MPAMRRSLPGLTGCALKQREIERELIQHFLRKIAFVGTHGVELPSADAFGCQLFPHANLEGEGGYYCFKSNNPHLAGVEKSKLLYFV